MALRCADADFTGAGVVAEAFCEELDGCLEEVVEVRCAMFAKRSSLIWLTRAGIAELVTFAEDAVEPDVTVDWFRAVTVLAGAAVARDEALLGSAADGEALPGLP